MKLRKTHILVECPELIASVRVGVLNVLSPLEKIEICEVRFRETRNIKKEDIVWCDVFICVRGCELLTAQIAKEVKRLGRRLFYFLDDDLLHLPEDSLAYQYFRYGNHQEALREILSISDGLWGVNTRIREEYLSLCGVDRWICTRVPVQIEACQHERSDANQTPVQVLYAGSVDHQNMIREVLSPAIRQVAAEYGNLVEFTFIGPDPDLKDCPQVHHRAFFENYDKYREFVSRGGFEIGLAPTKLGSFFQCKYYNKFVEYTAVGAVGIYTNCSLYNQVVSHEENGLLCENTPARWAEAIVKLAQQTKLRRTCYENAVGLIQREFEPEHVAMQLLSQLHEIQDFRGKEISVRQVRLYSPLVTFYLERTRYLFHTYHLLAVPVIAWKAVKKFVKWLFRK